MATFAGYEADGSISTSEPTNPDLGSRDTIGDPQLWLVDAADDGVHNDTQPVPEPQNPQTGVIADAYGWLHWYNKIHVTPMTIALGNLVSTQVREVSIFSTYFVDRLLNDVTLANGEGLSLTEPVATPYTLRPWEELIYELSISTEGPPTIDADLTFDTDVRDITVDITGVRIVVWRAAPNWIDPVLESLSWLTDVQRVESGEEQRIALRAGPRQTWRFTFDVDGRLRRQVEHELYSWGARIWALPIFVDGEPLTAPLLAGAISIPVTTATRDYHVGGIGILLSQDGLTYESFEIEAVNATTIDIARPLLFDWGYGTTVYPARQARLQSAQGLTRFTTGHATGAASFETIEQIERDTDAEPLYRGQPILEQLPNWREHPGADFRRQVEILDNLTGTVLLQDRSNLSEPVHSFLWSAFGRAEVGEQRNFLYSRRGRFKGIWVPTFSSDLRLVAQIGPAEVNIDVEACGLTQFVGADVHRKDIRIELIDGTVYYRRVSVFVVVDESTERMTISSALGTTVDPEEVALISWMMFARLDADEVDIEWPTAGLAETTLTLTGPRNER